jgi:hypothetical protein
MSSSILARVTLANEPAVFLLDSLNTVTNEIKLWNVNDDEPRTVDLSAYRNTRPASDAQEAQMVEAYRAKFQPPGGIILRRRLFKENPSTTGKHIVPKEQPTTVPFVDSKENKDAHKREASPEAAKEAHKNDVVQQVGLQQWEKMLLAEQITNHFAVAFAQAREHAIREIMK